MKYFSIVFNTTNGTKRTMRIQNPDENIPTTDIEEAIDELLINDVYDPEKGGLESFSKMELTTVERLTVL